MNPSPCRVYSLLPPDVDATTATGQPIWYAHPERTPVAPADLSIQLARICRYHGAVDVSVLAHLALCAELARALELPSSKVALAAAHDLHEAYIGDVHPRIKAMCRGWNELEAAWEQHVHRALGLAWRPLIEVLTIDVLALAVEARWKAHPAAVLIEQRMRAGWEARPHLEARAPTGGDIMDLGMTVADRVLPLAAAAHWRIVSRAIPSLAGAR